MSINVYTQNAAGAFGPHGSPESAAAIAGNVVNGIGDGCKPDVVGLFEAYPTDGIGGIQKHRQDAVDQMGAAGYVIGSFDYSEPDRNDRHSMIVAVKADRRAEGFTPINLTDGRRAIATTVRDPGSGLPAKVVLLHENDRHGRNVGDTTRLLRHLGLWGASTIGLPPEHAIVAGDLNSAPAEHAKPVPTWIIRRIAAMVDCELWPAEPPQELKPPMSFARIGDLALRTRAMLEGVSLKHFREAGFRDADPRHTPTMRLPGFGYALQLDHVLLRGKFAEHDFRTVEVPGVDHRGVFASVSPQRSEPDRG